MSYQILTAMGQLKAYDQALSSLNLYYGEMLRLGATTFWENFDFEDAKNSTGIDCLPEGNRFDIHGDGGEHCYRGFRHSLCHGWSSGVIAYLSETVLGIRVLASRKKVSVDPHLNGLNWIRGACPTPYGPIYVEHQYNDSGKVVTQITAPHNKKDYILEKV